MARGRRSQHPPVESGDENEDEHDPQRGRRSGGHVGGFGQEACVARYVTHPSARSLFAGGFVAGILGGFLIDGFLLVVHMAHVPATYQWIASGIVGRAAFANTDFVWLGIALHFAIAVAAAIAYAYVAQISGLLGRPLVGGIIFGIVMNGIMDLAVYEMRLGALPTSVHDIGIGLAAHILFFGIPIALFLSRYERVPTPYV